MSLWKNGDRVIYHLPADYKLRAPRLVFIQNAVNYDNTDAAAGLAYLNDFDVTPAGSGPPVTVNASCYADRDTTQDAFGTVTPDTDVAGTVMQVDPQTYATQVAFDDAGKTVIWLAETDLTAEPPPPPPGP